MGDNNSCNIQVVYKVRPLISREIDQKLSYHWRVKNDTLHPVDQTGRKGSFRFDRVYDENTKTSQVYDEVAKPIVEAAIAGFNGTIFAYGQTSSGKTYTMFGTEKSPGIIPLSVPNLFDLIKKTPNRDFLVRVSYIEIYNDTIKDLLDVEKKNIKVHETSQGVKVDVTERITASPEEVLKAMREGAANRQTGATNMNEESSRSHSIFQITIESREHVQGEEEVGSVNVSHLNLVDLAGSERTGQTGATGLRFKESTFINKSLSVLGLVIKQLSEDPNKYVNYRDSKLTRILQNSLGGNGKIVIICAVTPASLEETASTLHNKTEETRAVTLTEKKKFEDVIDVIDSDDDDPITIHQACSPHNKCYGASKTPPYVLRKKAKVAENELEDILELTQREKIYTPFVAHSIASQREEINSLSKETMEKDSLLDLLRNKIIKTEEEVKTITSAKQNLETMCKDYHTKLTDWEVSYEALKKKAKNREEELLSLLEEQKNINSRTEDCGKVTIKPFEREMFFMDMSKDISLVNRDNESTASANDEDSSAQIQHLVTDMKAQLTAKCQTINELEANIFAEKQKIESLEMSSHKLQRLINGFKDKFGHINNENTFLKSTIENLNSTIQSQKLTIEAANNDIKSYKSLIQELQIKLTNKENILNVKDNETVLENMIANDLNFITNNENMKNIVQSFRSVLNSRYKEIDKLKTTIKTNSDLSNDYNILKKHVEQKENQIIKLIDEIEKLKDQLNDNNLVINNLMSAEQEVIQKVSDLEKQNDILQKIIEETTIQIEKLKENNEQLLRAIAELEKQAGSKESREWEMTESELRACKQELSELKQRYKELDEECQKYAEYLRERDEQCRRLKEAKAALESQQISDVLKENEKLKKKNSKLVYMCKKRGKPHANKENEQPTEQVRENEENR